MMDKKDAATDKPIVRCAECQHSFTWLEAYQFPWTPCLNPPPGIGRLGDRYFCPNCGALLIEYVDEEVLHRFPGKRAGWNWFGENGKMNAEVTTYPPGGVSAGSRGKTIPLRYVPLAEEEPKIDIEAIKSHERGSGGKGEPESSKEASPIVQQGYAILKQGKLEEANQIFE